MNEFKIINAKITNTFLGLEDHGILTAYLYMEFDIGDQGFGGYALKGQAMSIFIKGCIDTVSTKSWEDLKGKYVRIKHNHSKILEIGHIMENKWFNPEESFKQLQNE